MSRTIHVPENPVSHFLFNSTRSAWIWLIVRLYLGWKWLDAGWHKINSDTWVGKNAGKSL